MLYQQRDALLPVIVILFASKKNSYISKWTELPGRFTLSDRVKDIPE